MSERRYTVRNKRTGKVYHLTADELARMPGRESPNIRFLWNGIKANNGRLQRAGYSYSEERTTHSGHYIPEHLSIYAKEYSGFSKEISAVLQVENNSDSMTDYFEKDRIKLLPTHPYFDAAMAAYRAQQEHYDRHSERRKRKG